MSEGCGGWWRRGREPQKKMLCFEALAAGAENHDEGLDMNGDQLGWRAAAIQTTASRTAASLCLLDGHLGLLECCLLDAECR